MRMVLSEVDLRLSVGEVVYPPGGRLGPRRQLDVQLVVVHEGSARIEVDGAERPVLRPGWTALLLPGHRERFAFDAGRPTRHSWVQVGSPRRRSSRSRRRCRRRRRSPSSCDRRWPPRKAPPGPLLRALAAAALWRYAADAETRPPG